MPNHAIVIGINEYRDSDRFPRLTRPAVDAIRMARWLLDSAGADGVAEENLVLLLSPNDDAALAGIVDALATSEERAEAARLLARLATLGNRAEAGSDWINKAVRDLHARAGGQGGRLYFYYAGHGLSAALDALGNDVEDALVPFDYDSAIPRLAISVPSITRTLLATSCPEQFFFLDCCRNQLQREEIARVGRLQPNRRRIPTDQYVFSATALGLKAADGDGSFSDVLFRGLAGDGSAKAFSRSSGAYEVRAERLFQYLQRGFEALGRQPYVDGGEGVEPRPQRPRLGGEHGGDPILKTLKTVEDVSFRITVQAPAGFAAGTKVAEARLFGDGLPPEPPRDATAGATVDFALAPRLYFVQVVPEPGLSGPTPTALEVYDDPTDFPVTLAPAVAAAAVAPAEAATTVAPLFAAPPIERRGSIRDPRDEPPRIARSWLGRLLGRGEKASAGVRIRVACEVVAPAAGRLVDPIVAGRLATPEGVAAYLDELEARVWPLDGEPGDPRRLERSGDAAGTGSFSWTLTPGPYRLSLGGPSHGTTTFELVVPPDRATVLDVRQGADGRVDISVSMPLARVESDSRDHIEFQSTETLQRLLRDGDVERAAAFADQLLDATNIGSPPDPTAVMLGALASLRRGRLDALAVLAARLTDRHPDLPDGHAMLGLCRLREGDREAARWAFAAALARGLPMLASVLHATDDAVDALAIGPAEAPRIPLLVQAGGSLIPGSLWSARRPVAAVS